MNDDRPSPGGQPHPKRQRVLACRRCRMRKQRCEETRPCSNCAKSGEECLPTAPAPRNYIESEYMRELEERVAELESLDPTQNQDHFRTASVGTEAHGMGAMMPPRDRRPSYISQQDAVSAGRLATQEGQRRTSTSASGSSPKHTDGVEDGEELEADHLILGLITSPEQPRIERSVTGSEASPVLQRMTITETDFRPQSDAASLPIDLQDILLGAYRDRAQAQYPFFLWGDLLTWHTEWLHCPPRERRTRLWQGFFVNVVYATAIILLRRPSAGQCDAISFYRNGIALLPYVLEKPDKILHIQAYLLLAVRSLHQSSTERIISLASTTIRCCIQQQLHLVDTEPPPLDPQDRVRIQLRRRCFWSAYNMDRNVMFIFDLPPSIPDAMITTPPYANVDDDKLSEVAARTPSHLPLEDSPVYTCVSSSLHILQARRIQSEISAVTLRWDYSLHHESAPEWRVRILAELENYKSRVQSFAHPQSKGYTSQRWLAMIYHMTLLMLYRPTKRSVLGPAGDWTVQASSQACLMFRKSQMDRQIAQPWLGMLAQFQSGIALLYCFWATPPQHRTENYDSLDVPDALRACSNILALMADRWPKAECLRDTFELLAREIPLVDRPGRAPTRLSEKTISTIYECLPQVREIVLNRSILRMLEDMISEDFPRSRAVEQAARPPSVAGMLASSTTRLGNRSGNATPAGGMPFQLPFTMDQNLNFGHASMDIRDLNANDLPTFPGIFDFETWE